MKFLGSPNKSVCVTGFDQLSLIPGSSSAIFALSNLTVSTFRSGRLPVDHYLIAPNVV